VTSTRDPAEQPSEVNASPGPLRCAIYTRKSTEDGLNQPFNTLEAQREGAEAYILSQRHVGWTVVAEHYDDGGYTGGNVERPALQKLLGDMEAGRIDCVVVYKVDRLSRSLLDFARLMDVFERHQVSLVSVTQPLNTTMSLGRLTLNILLSFAQFEREIISERTRDKMAAARKKGKWMGGMPVLGYDVAPGGGRLVVNHEEAKRVRALFALYLECRSVDQLLTRVQAQSWRNKVWTTKTIPADGGRPFTKASLQRLLSNVLYIGQIRHQGTIYPGEQVRMVEESVWREAQKLLAEERGQRLCGKRTGMGGRERMPEAVAQDKLPERVPRIARLMALALKLEQMKREAVVSDYAVLAALGRVSRARVTQIMNLLNLAPDIQEQILFLSLETAEQCGICEQSIRRLSSLLRWNEQRAQWEALNSREGRHAAGRGQASRSVAG
jgi:DNA invertase Pin-like site-specific DNA recombinase